MKKDIKQKYYPIPVFEKGDLISSISKKEVRLITGVKDGCYEYINLYEQRFKDVFGQYHTIAKGSVSTQPIDIIHKHYSILDLREY